MNSSKSTAAQQAAAPLVARKLKKKPAYPAPALPFGKAPAKA